MLKVINADLHIHTCLSPCGDLEMSPKKIVAESLKKGMDAIAICDHNSAKNVAAVLKAAEGQRLLVLPGMEVCTREEVHVLTIFDSLKSAYEVQALIDGLLNAKNDPDVFGMQVIANEFDEVVGFEDKLLIGAVDLSVDRLVEEVHHQDGIAIASHIDRETYSVIGQLGFIPESVKFDALELSSNIAEDAALVRFADYRNYMFVRNSDAHYLDDIGKNTSRYLLGELSFDEFAWAFKSIDGRMVTAA